MAMRVHLEVSFSHEMTAPSTTTTATRIHPSIYWKLPLLVGIVAFSLATGMDFASARRRDMEQESAASVLLEDPSAVERDRHRLDEIRRQLGK